MDSNYNNLKYINNFRIEYILRMSSVFIIFLIITVLYFIIGVKDLTPTDYLGTISFLVFWNVFITVIGSLIVFMTISRSFKNGNPDKIKRSINRLPVLSSLLIASISFFYCALITLGGLKTEAESYKSLFKIIEFSISIIYTYIIIPVYYATIIIENLLMKIRKKIFIIKNIQFESSGKKFRNELFVSFIIISLYPIINILFSLYTHGLIATILKLNPYLISYFIIVVLGVLFIVFFKTRSFTEPIQNLSLFVEDLKNGNFSKRLPVTVNNEIGNLTFNINRMAEGLEDREKIKDIFGKMVDPAIRDYILKENIKLGGILTEGTVLFSDIRDFTTISEKMPPEKVVFFLNKYFEVMSNCITKTGGVVNKYIGDAIMALFGVPVKSENQSIQAIDSAIKMQQSLKNLNEEFKKLDLPALKTGIGIHKGKLVAGNIGSTSRMEYTVIGDTVNLCSRIEGVSKYYGDGILISDTIKMDIENNPKYIYRFLLNVKVKGRNAPVSIYEVLNGLPDIEQRLINDYLEEYKKGVDFYNNKIIDEAKIIFENILKKNENDKIVRYYIKECKYFMNKEMALCEKKLLF